MVKTNMKLSVIIPIYNTEKYLRECIDSVLLQIVEDMEIILIDDGSTDNSFTICDEYAHKYNFIRVVHKRNEGVAIARNTGIKMSQGEYILFLDSDDMLSPKILEKVEKDIETKLDLYSYQIQKITSDKEIINNAYYQKNMEEGKYSAKEFIKKYSKQYDGYLPWMTQNVYKRSIIVDNNIAYPSGVTVAEDMDFFMQFAKYFSTVSFYYDNIVLYRVNRGGSAMTRMEPRAVEDVMKITSKYFLDKSTITPKLFANAYAANVWKISLIEDKETRKYLMQKIDLKIIFNSTGIRYLFLKIIFIFLGKEKTIEWIRKRQLKKMASERR